MRTALTITAVLSLAPGLAWAAAETALEAPGPPSFAGSFLRVLGGLAVVLALFLGAAWAVRHGRKAVLRHGQPAKLSVLEVCSLGPRQALYVVGYERERLLLSSSAAGIHLVGKLPPSETEALDAPRLAGNTFAQVLWNSLGRG